MTPYVEVPPSAITEGRRLFAEHAACLAACSLGTPVPAVRWFHRSLAPDGWPFRTWQDERTLDGLTDAERPKEVWIFGGLPRRSLADAVAHETHHAAWFQEYGSGWYSPTEIRVMEAAAVAFATAFVKHWRF